MTHIGVSLLLDCFGVNTERCSDSTRLLELLRSVAAAAELTIVGSGAHQFENGGATAFLLLSESHVSAHSWPEHDYLAIDLFSCGDSSKLVAAEEVATRISGASYVQRSIVERRVEIGSTANGSSTSTGKSSRQLEPQKCGDVST